jgi:DNA-binding FadR family transcriptional regulator
MPASGELIKPIGRANLVQEVVRSFADLIMQRHWKPGDLIPSEKELAARFGVGRSTIREAMQSLVIMGVLEIRPGEGSYIREPSSELLSSAFLWGLLLSPRSNGHLTQVRLCIEVNCAVTAAEVRSQETIDKLYALLDLMKTHQGDDRRVMEYDNRFHIAIAEATGNPIFVTLVETLQSIVRLWFPITCPDTGSADNTLAEHQAIADAIRMQDRDAAREAMRTHLANAAARLSRLLAMETTRKGEMVE